MSTHWICESQEPDAQGGSGREAACLDPMGPPRLTFLRVTCDPALSKAPVTPNLEVGWSAGLEQPVSLRSLEETGRPCQLCLEKTDFNHGAE